MCVNLLPSQGEAGSITKAVHVTLTSPETENVGREISNEGIPAYSIVPAQQAVTIKAEKLRQALNLLRQCERDGYGVITTMTVQL
jgi:hypothetical protein